METQKAFEVITAGLDSLLKPKGYTRENVADSDEQSSALYIGEDAAYSIVYTFDNQRMVLRSCSVAEGEPDNNWKILATWLFDPETDSMKEAESIRDDFVETIRGPRQTAVRKKQKKRKKDGENTVDPLFLANRMVTYFPELKDEIAYEKAHYEQFRGITFADEHIAERFGELAEESNDNKLQKISEGLSTMYTMGDLDTKGIITYILLNAVSSDEKFTKLIAAFNENDRKICVAARNLRGKKIKPEKPKKVRSYTADSLNEY